MKKIGRPSFKIVPDRLVSSRKEAGFTQVQLAGEIHKRLARAFEERSRETGYQRIERTGDTSLKFATCVSEILAERLSRKPSDVLAFLCGGAPEAPPDRLEELQAQLEFQLQVKSGKALHHLLKRYTEDQFPIKELARDLATRIELAHLESRQDELEALAAITGWSIDKLLRPISSLGHWLLVSRAYGASNSKLMLGLDDVLHHIQVDGAKWLDAIHESDARVELKNDGLWIRVELEHPRHKEIAISFSFVRCVPSSSGLSWVKPTSWDLFWIARLEAWARSHSNFVKLFEPQSDLPSDLKKLRLVVAKRTVPESPEVDTDERNWMKTLFVHKGSTEELPPGVMDNFRADGSSHDLVTNWLSSGLWDALLPFLSDMPASWWRIRSGAGGIQIGLEFGLRDLYAQKMDIGNAPRQGTRLAICLAEELADGRLSEVPWRPKSVQSVVDARLIPGLKHWVDSVPMGGSPSALSRPQN